MKKSELLRQVLALPEERLIGAIAEIIAHRKRQAEGLPEDASFDLKIDLVEFLSTCSARQLRLLHEIALGLEITCEGPIH
jgi:hypothetical protein